MGTGVSTAGSLFVDSASPDGTEEPALASGAPVEVLVPGSAEQLEQAASVLEAHALVVSDAATALTRVEVTGWRGTARDAYDVVAGEQPRRWSIASAALSAAAQAIRAYAAHLAPARAVATEAVWLYQQYLALEASLEALTLDRVGRPSAGDTGLVGYRAARLLDADSVGQTGGGIAPAGGMILGPTATTLIPALARDADAVRRQAIATLVRARGIMGQAGTVAAEQLRRATAEAPEARRAWESTIRPAAAEHVGHVALDAASFAPGPVGLGAAALNTAWYVAAGQRTDAAYSAMGVIPLGRLAKVGLALREGAVASKAGTSTTTDELARRSMPDRAAVLAGESDLDGLAASFGLTAIAPMTYRSPAGLVYGPMSISTAMETNRLTHVLLHGTPDPADAGHSVFSGGTSAVVDLVDRAWGMPKTHDHPSDPARWVVDFGDEVVGSEGQTRMVIIATALADGSSRVITAYPIP